MAAVPPHFRQTLVFLLLFISLHPPSSSSLSDSEALLKLKKSFENTDTLDETWTGEKEPCAGKTSWAGVVCFNGIITGLRLGNMNLGGTIDADALSNFTGLRTVSFFGNNFSGEMPALNSLGALKAIYLSGNNFSGEIPARYFSGMGSLKKLWLDGNSFSGEIPVSLASVPRLMELHLENNHFTGIIPAMNQSSLKSFNVSNNLLEGSIPASMVRLKFDPSSFAGNPGLCGETIGKVCVPDSDESVATDSGQTTSDYSGEAAGVGSSQTKPVHTGKAISMLIVFGILLIALVAGVVVVGGRRDNDFDTLGREKSSVASRDVSSRAGRDAMSSRGGKVGRVEVKVAEPPNLASPSQNSGAGLVFVNGEKPQFALTDLMKAAAEVLGTGGLGSSYKAVTANGVAVVVKRMRELNRIGKEGFEGELRRIGRLRHRNILTPLAYHYRKEEKLLVFDYIPKGSLLYLLHGERGTARTALDWQMRLKIVQGIAQAMAYLHRELNSSEVPHGNLKSGNVLLGPDNEPLLADYGFIPLVEPTLAAQTMLAYKSPEFIQLRQVTPKSDVWSLGVIILEILTGKFPTQYLNHGKGGTDIVQWARSAILEKKEGELLDPDISSSKNSRGDMERLLHVGVACTEPNVEQRLDMMEAVKRIAAIGEVEDESLIPVASLRDGYGETSARSQSSTRRDGYSELMTLRSGRENESSRRDAENFKYDIS